jgi:hypothetical protein
MDYFDYDNDDYYVEKKMSELKRERNAFLAIGAGCGAIVLLIIEFILGWATLGHIPN